jgi:CheY-like chemotaxis protein
VALESVEGTGTTLTLFLPRSAPLTLAAGADPDADAEARAAVPAGLRVLLVEDDAEVRKVVHRDLESLGCFITQAASGEEALALLARGASLDLLLSDIALGAGLRGTQLAAEAQQQRPGLAVLLMSGFSSDLLEADRDAPPEWELLQKPYRRTDLARAIARLTAR